MTIDYDELSDTLYVSLKQYDYRANPVYYIENDEEIIYKVDKNSLGIVGFTIPFLVDKNGIVLKEVSDMSSEYQGII